MAKFGTWIISGACFLGILSCNDSNFASSNDKVGKPSSPAKPPVGTVTPEPKPVKPKDECFDGDKVNFRPNDGRYPGLGACLDAGRTYNFDSKQCITMRKADFDCSWDGLFDAMRQIGLAATPKLKSYQEQGAKMISCGQSADKALIVAQILVPPDGGFVCEQGGIKDGKPLTGCYGGEGPQPGQSQEDYVYSCINKTTD